MITEKELEAKHEAAKKEAFRRWMQEPMTRALISTIPSCDNIEIILQAAFDTGFSHGSGHMAVTILSTIMDRPRR